MDNYLDHLLAISCIYTHSVITRTTFVLLNAPSGVNGVDRNGKPGVSGASFFSQRPRIAYGGLFISY